MHKRAVLLALLLYSVLHFFHSALGGFSRPLERRCGGDFEAAFPPPFARDTNPKLAAEFRTWGREGAKRGWNYGPIFQALTAPLALLPTRASVCSTWLAMNLVFIGLAAVLIVSVFLSDRMTPTVAGIIVVMWMNFYPLLEAMSQGVIEIFQLFLIAVMLRWLVKSRPKAAGAVAGTAVMVKFLPAVFVALFLVKRRWVEFAVACGVAIVIAALAEPTLGWKDNLTMNQLAPMSSYRTSQLSQTLSGAVMHAFAVYPEGIREPLSEVPRSRERPAVWTVRVCLAVVALAICALFVARRNVSDMLGTEVALLCSVMIYLPQWNHQYYQTTLLLPLTLLLKWALAGARGMSWWLGAIYVGTASFLLPLSAVGRLFGLTGDQTLTTVQHLSIPSLANASLIAVIAWAYWTRQEFAKD